MSTLNGDSPPRGWAIASLCDIAEINPRSPDRVPNDDDLVSFVPMAAVETMSGRLNARDLREWKAVKKGFTRFQEGDVLFAKITPCMENGKVALASGLHAGIGAGSTEFHVLRPTRAAEAKFLMYYVLQEQFRKDARAKMTGTAGQLRVPASFMEERVFALPPVSEQRRIVGAVESYLTKLDVAVAALERVRANLKRYRASVLKAAVEGRLVPTEAELARSEGRDFEPASVLLDRILAERRLRWEESELARMKAAGNPPKDDRWKSNYEEPAALDTSTLPQLPEGWCWARADQLSEFITKGTTPRSSVLTPGHGDVPFIKVYNLTFDGSLDFRIAPTFIPKDVHVGELARSIVVPGDVLMNIVGPPLGKVSIVPVSYPTWNINQAIVRFRCVRGFANTFLTVVLRNESVVRWAIRRAKATAGQFNLTLEICRALPIPLAPESEQLRIVTEVSRLLSVSDGVELETEASLRRCTRLRQSILKWAFEGKLVDQDPNDEPASVLLKRIRPESAAAAPPRKPKKHETRETEAAK